MNKTKLVNIKIYKLKLKNRSTSTVIPIIVGVLGTIRKGIDKKINKITSSPVYKRFKNAFCGNTH